VISIRQIFGYFFWLGATGFGGPVALIAHIKTDWVDRKKWMTEEEYLEGLGMATALPGPIASQLAIYCGWLKKGLWGGTVAGVSFIIIPFLICVGLGFLYQRYQTFAWMENLFYGIAPVIAALIANACLKLAKTTIKNKTLAILFAVVFGIVFFSRFNFVYLLLAVGTLGAIIHAKKPVTKMLSLHWPLFIFFFKAGLLIFGSGLVILPFLQQFVVHQYQWISEQAFLDSIAVGMMTPGPVLITATFVGFLVEGIGGAFTATAGMFLPSLLLIFAAAPLLRRHKNHRWLAGFIQWISVGVASVLAATSIGILQKSIIDWPTVAIALLAFLTLQRFRIPDPILVAIGGLTGLLLKTAL